MKHETYRNRWPGILRYAAGPALACLVVSKTYGSKPPPPVITAMFFPVKYEPLEIFVVRRVRFHARKIYTYGNFLYIFFLRWILRNVTEKWKIIIFTKAIHCIAVYVYIYVHVSQRVVIKSSTLFRTSYTYCFIYCARYLLENWISVARLFSLLSNLKVLFFNVFTY